MQCGRTRELRVLCRVRWLITWLRVLAPRRCSPNTSVNPCPGFLSVTERHRGVWPHQPQPEDSYSLS
ncbi:hypothetical protein OBBRIDRAFT_12419 [Obba rivulosa]|uniref:Secreted protein n=1 Tax=Obba rivulosa TaxID=1052685 RepID=A0A8E2DVE2_9APHY|nr:hypothetical protein OBBRIDRAFT_12419 [Obba rivulosa]